MTAKTKKGARRKGHNGERWAAKEFRGLGFPAITTRESRGGSWSKTDEGTDLRGTEPWLVQIKFLKEYASVSTIEEIHGKGWPLLLTHADRKPVMAILPWEILKKLLQHDL